MKWIVVLLITTSVMFAQRLVDLTDCYTNDFKANDEIIIASAIDKLHTFERFTIVKIMDSTITLFPGEVLNRKYLFLKDKKGNEFQLKTAYMIFNEIYDAKLVDKKLLKNKYKFYYVGGSDVLKKLQPWVLYEVIDVMYDYSDNNSYFVMKNGKNKYYVDDWSLKSEYFVTAEDYNRLVNKYGYTFGRDIMQRVVRIGMTPDMVYESWGSPDDTSEYITAYGSQVIYQYGYSTVTFINGKVYSIYRP